MYFFFIELNWLYQVLFSHQICCQLLFYWQNCLAAWYVASLQDFQDLWNLEILSQPSGEAATGLSAGRAVHLWLSLAYCLVISHETMKLECLLWGCLEDMDVAAGTPSSNLGWSWSVCSPFKKAPEFLAQRSEYWKFHQLGLASLLIFYFIFATKHSWSCWEMPPNKPSCLQIHCMQLFGAMWSVGC